MISGYSKGDVRRHDTASLRDHYLNYQHSNQNVALWFRVEPELHVSGYAAALRSGSLKIEAFWERVPSGRKVLGQGIVFALAVSPHPEGGDPLWSGWWLTRETAQWCSVAVVDEDEDLLAPVARTWPLDALAKERVALIGAGSIGSAAAESLCAYGTRALAIIDPDRLLPHNTARHRVGRSQIGRHKATALAERLRARDSRVEATPLILDVIDDADQVRPVFAQASAVLVASDGVESRRVANHLAVRAGIPAIFACVLDDGRYGELIRVIPHTTGVPALRSCAARRERRDGPRAEPRPWLRHREPTLADGRSGRRPRHRRRASREGGRQHTARTAGLPRPAAAGGSGDHGATTGPATSRAVRHRVGRGDPVAPGSTTPTDLPLVRRAVTLRLNVTQATDATIRRLAQLSDDGLETGASCSAEVRATTA